MGVPELPEDLAGALRLSPGQRWWPALAPSDADAPLTCLLAGIIVKQPAHLLAILFFEHYLTLRAEVFIARNARPADSEQAHHGLL